MPILRQILKHAAIIVLPEAFLLGVLAVVTHAPDSAFLDGIIGKRAVQVMFGGVAVMFALFLIHYYFKLIEEKCRAPREIEFVEMQPVRMRHLYQRFPRHASPGEVLPTNGFRISEDREDGRIDVIIDDGSGDSDVSEGSEDFEDLEEV